MINQFINHDGGGNYDINIEINQDLLLCPICYQDKPKNHFNKLSCNHIFCKECQENYFQSCMKSGNVTSIIIIIPI